MINKPTLTAAMTPFPHSLPPNAPVVEAATLMRQHRIHHLPVADGDWIVGILSARDLATQGSKSTAVRECHNANPYLVDAATPLDEVLFHMADHQIECAIVTRDGKLAGIFTAVDACRTFAGHLRALYPAFSDDSAG